MTARAIIYGLGSTRVTLRDATGANLARLTLQCEDREGLELSFTPEGVTSDLGSGAGFRRAWTPRKFRAAVAIKWTYALASRVETWSGSDWTGSVLVDTAEALRQIHNAAWIYPCLVQPHLGSAWAFEAQPDPGADPYALQDVKGVVHADLSLRLQSRAVVDIPDWWSAE